MPFMWRGNKIASGIFVLASELTFSRSELLIAWYDDSLHPYTQANYEVDCFIHMQL